MRRKSFRLTQATLLGLAAGIAQAATLASLPAPELFAPGIISGPQNDGAPTFTRDGRTLYFERSYAHRTVIFEARRTGAGWSVPEVASFSGPTSDQQPALAPNGHYLVYVSARSRPPTQPDGRTGRYNHLWRVDRVGSSWSSPVELPSSVNISDRVFKPTVAENGDLYFMSASRSDANGPKWRLFRAAKSPTDYDLAQPLPFSDGAAIDVDPFVAPDGSYLIFSSRGRQSPDDGHEHLYVVIRQGEGWGPVTPLHYAGDDWGADDGEAQVSPDGARLYFTSARSAPVRREESRQALLEDIKNAEIWDNGNTNSWSLPLHELFGANGVVLP